MRCCPRCSLQKDESEFGKNKLRKSGLDTYCKQCRYEGNKVYRLANAEKVSSYRKNYYVEHQEVEKTKMKDYREKKTTSTDARKQQRERRLKKDFGLSLEHYDELLQQQNNVCAICGNPNQTKGPLAVDHNHNTGKIRELLCIRCNMGLGAVNEDISILTAMIEYLKKHSIDHEKLN